MRNLFKLCVAVMVLATLSLTAKADTRFSAYLTGGQESSATGSTAIGYAKLTLNAAENSISYTLTYSGLSNVETATHIHGDRSPGLDAGVLFPLNSSGATSSTVAGSFSVTAAQVTSLKNGLWYINVHTGNFPDGEIRGQINPSIIISEFRFRGGNGGDDEFIEIYNDSDVPITVTDISPDADASTNNGWEVMMVNDAATVSTHFVIPEGTIIPARGHFLAVNVAASGYSLGAYAAGNTVRGDLGGDLAGYATGVVDTGGIALFRTANAANLPATGTTNPNISGAYRLDAVGFNAAHLLFFEGTALATANAPTANDQFTFYRNLSAGTPKDIDTNTADFLLVSTDGNVSTSSGTVSVPLGAPGPENLASPRRNTAITPGVVNTGEPAFGVNNNNYNRDPTPGTFPAGTMSIRRTLTNPAGAPGPITRLRIRIRDITTLNSPVVVTPPQADLRAVTSSDVAVTGTVTTALGITLEEPPTQASGGGLNSSWTVPLPGGGLAPAATIGVNITLGVNVAGNFRFAVTVEALP